MAGNSNSGRRPKPPSHNDALSELLVDLMHELNDHAAARKKYEQRERAFEHRVAALLRDAWNRHKAAYQPDELRAA